MPRKYDADLCRAKEWGPGVMLRMETDEGRVSRYVLTAIGLRSILVTDVYHKRLAVGESPRPPLVLGRREYQMAGSLYRYAIVKIGQMDLQTNEFTFDSGTSEAEEYQEYLKRCGA